MIINQFAKTAEDLGGAFSGDRLKYSLEMTVLGLVAVFAVLAIIWAILALFKVIMYDIPNKNKGNVPNVTDKALGESTTENQNISGISTTASYGDDATVAAIIAAISAYIASDEKLSEEYSGGFRVVSFKRVRDKASWNSKK